MSLVGLIPELHLALDERHGGLGAFLWGDAKHLKIADARNAALRVRENFLGQFRTDILWNRRRQRSRGIRHNQVTHREPALFGQLNALVD